MIIISSSSRSSSSSSVAVEYWIWRTRYTWAPIKPPRGQTPRPPRPKATSVLTYSKACVNRLRHTNS